MRGRSFESRILLSIIIITGNEILITRSITRVIVEKLKKTPSIPLLVFRTGP